MDSQADRRRQALKNFLQAHQLSRGGLARRADLSPNIIYNFLAGRSTYLSQPTLERISQALGVPITTIVGIDSPSPARPGAMGSLNEGGSSYVEGRSAPLPGGLTSLTVEGTIMGSGIWGETMFFASDAEDVTSFRLPSLYAAKSFAVRARAGAAGALCPDEAVLACLPVRDYLHKLAGGDVVVSARRNPLGLFETTVRRYNLEDNRHFLGTPGSGSSADELVELKSPLARPAATGYQDVFIHSVVLAYVVVLPASRR